MIVDELRGTGRNITDSDLEKYLELHPDIDCLDLGETVHSNMAGWSGLTRLPDKLPQKLTTLCLFGFTDLTCLPGELPRGLLTLDLNSCTSLTCLPSMLPPELGTLDLTDCASLTHLPESLPPKLKTLDLKRCASLTHLPESLPPKLKTLDLKRCASLKHLPAQLPSMLTTFDVSECLNLIELPEVLPEGLTRLSLLGCIRLTQLPETLPPALDTLDLRGCSSLNHLPASLPPGLTTLSLIGCSSLTHLPDELPAGLTSLKLTGCTALTSLPDHLPLGLTTLALSGCSSLSHLPDKLPEGVRILDLSHCSKLTYLPDSLPEAITILDLISCPSLRCLPENLPAGLTTLKLNGCSSLSRLPENLPAGLVKLSLSSCSSLTDLPLSLPDGVTALDLTDCSLLRGLPEKLPAKLTILKLNSCTSLVHLPEILPAGLCRLELSQCSDLIHLPDTLPVGITELDLSNCTDLLHLPDNLPERITALKMNNCSKLSYLSEKLPGELITLQIANCTAIKMLPADIPPGVTLIDVQGCISLTSLPDVLPKGLTTLRVRGGASLTHLPEKIPAGVTNLDLTGCVNLRDLGLLSATVSVELDTDSNYSLISLSPACKAKFEIADSILPQFLPSSVVSEIDITYPTSLLAARLAWRRALRAAADAIDDLTSTPSERTELINWLQFLSSLPSDLSTCDHPSRRSQMKHLKELFDRTLEYYLSMPTHDLLREGGAVGVAINTLHGGTLNFADQANLRNAIHFSLRKNSDSERTEIVIGLKSSAFSDALEYFSKAENGHSSSTYVALRLVLTFGKHWHNWIRSRARALGLVYDTPRFLHDASFWLPLEPTAKLRGLANWLFDVHHRGKPASMLGIIARNWSSLDPAARTLPYHEMLELACKRSYPDAHNGKFASESAAWGIPIDDYQAMEERYMHSLTVPSPFPTEMRWTVKGLTGRFLPRDDVRGVYLGNHTNCCQHPGGMAASVAWYGQEKETAGFFVVEDLLGNIVAQSFTWISHDGGLCFDSIESKGLGKREPAVVQIYTFAAEALSDSFHTITVGRGMSALEPAKYWNAATAGQVLEMSEFSEEIIRHLDSSRQFLLRQPRALRP